MPYFMYSFIYSSFIKTNKLDNVGGESGINFEATDECVFVCPGIIVSGTMPQKPSGFTAVWEKRSLFVFSLSLPIPHPLTHERQERNAFLH